MTPWTALARRPERPVETACGEIEHERFSRRANGAEVLVVYVLVQAALWSGIGHAPDAGRGSWLQTSGLTVAALVLCFVTAVAPWLHGDRWHDLGLSAPRELRERWPEYGWASRLGAIGLSLAVPMLIVGVGWETMLARLGIRAAWPEVYQVLVTAPWKHVGSAGAAAALGLALAGVLIRWTNIAAAARAAAWPVAIARDREQQPDIAERDDDHDPAGEHPRLAPSPARAGLKT
jgi:hypothetical protein